MEGEISRNNKIENLGNNLIISGEEKQDDIILYFISKNTKKGSSDTNIINDETRFYCYTQEEIDKISDIINKSKYGPKLKDEEILYRKIDVEFSDSDTVIWKEYRTIFTQKDTYPFSGDYSFSSGYFKGDVGNLNISEVKCNNEELIDYCGTESSDDGIISLSAYIPYSLNKNDNPYVTLEMTIKYKFKLNGKFEIPFENKQDNLFSLTIFSSSYKYLSMKGKISKNNKLNNSDDILTFSGKEKQSGLKFYFLKN